MGGIQKTLRRIHRKDTDVRETILLDYCNIVFIIEQAAYYLLFYQRPSIQGTTLVNDY